MKRTLNAPSFTTSSTTLTNRSHRWTLCRAQSPSPGPERTGFCQSNSAGLSPETACPARHSPSCPASRTLRRLTIPSSSQVPSLQSPAPQRCSHPCISWPVAVPIVRAKLTRPYRRNTGDWGLIELRGVLAEERLEASDPVVEQQRSCLRGRRTGTRLSTMTESYRSTDDIDPCVRVYGTRVHNLRGVDVVAPRDALVAFTGISGSGKSSLAFGTIYAEAQRRYFESVAPYARRLLLPTGAPKVDDITGLPPAVALQQRRGSATSRSTVGTVTTLSNLLRMLFSRAGTYPPGATERLDSDAFSPNTAVGACPECHGLGRIHRVSEETLVPAPSLSIREGAVAAWPGAWQGQNLRDILVTLGYDIDKPWRKLPKRQRNWILFTDEQPTVEIDPSQHPVQADYYYNGTFSSAERHVRHTMSNSHSAMMRRRVLQFVDSVECPLCDGSGLRPEALRVTFGGRIIADYVAMPLAELADTLRATASRTDAAAAYESTESGELTEVATMIAADLVARLEVLIDLGLGYLTLSRRTPTVSPGELQRLRLGTQLRAGLFGVLYVLDEPSAGLPPADAEPLLDVLDRLRRAGNSLFVVEHDMDVVRRADWIVDVGPGAGELGGSVLYSGPVPGLADIEESITRRYLFEGARPPPRQPRTQSGRLRLRGICFHNLRDLDVALPLGVYTAVTGVSGSGKSTLVVKVLGDVVNSHLGAGRTAESAESGDDQADTGIIDLDHDASVGVP